VYVAAGDKHLQNNKARFRECSIVVAGSAQKVEIHINVRQGTLNLENETRRFRSEDVTETLKYMVGQKTRTVFKSS